MRFSLTLLSSLVAFAGCAGPGPAPPVGEADEHHGFTAREDLEPRDAGGPEIPDEEAAEETANENGGRVATRVGRTLIYPVRWGRAEDLAVTLQELLSGQYGNEVRVIPHPDTNHLLIYLPPH
ncbi:MAG: hypothetical protein O7J95_15325 [Planctomycetota bacterium]|nr:hypothetical protein [Planctomycetota bacterium]